MDPGALGILDRSPRGIDVGSLGAREPGDHRALDRARDALHRLEIPR